MHNNLNIYFWLSIFIYCKIRPLFHRITQMITWLKITLCIFLDKKIINAMHQIKGLKDIIKKEVKKMYIQKTL